jgi:hypothetical protein
MYSFWQAITGTTAASKAKVIKKAAPKKVAPKKAAPKKTAPKKTPAAKEKALATPKPKAKVPRKSVQCFLFYWSTRTLTPLFCSPPSDLKVLQLA